MEGFVHDLIFWRKQLFETGVSDPNVFDASIIASIDSLIRVLSGGQEEETDGDDELELF